MFILGFIAGFSKRRADNRNISSMQAGVLGHSKMTNPSAVLTTLQVLVAILLLLFIVWHISS